MRGDSTGRKTKVSCEDGGDARHIPVGGSHYLFYWYLLQSIFHQLRTYYSVVRSMSSDRDGRPSELHWADPHSRLTNSVRELGEGFPASRQRGLMLFVPCAPNPTFWLVLVESCSREGQTEGSQTQLRGHACRHMESVNKAICWAYLVDLRAITVIDSYRASVHRRASRSIPQL